MTGAINMRTDDKSTSRTAYLAVCVMNYDNVEYTRCARGLICQYQKYSRSISYAIGLRAIPLEWVNLIPTTWKWDVQEFWVEYHLFCCEDLEYTDCIFRGDVIRSALHGSKYDDIRTQLHWSHYTNHVSFSNGVVLKMTQLPCFRPPRPVTTESIKTQF